MVMLKINKIFIVTYLIKSKTKINELTVLVKKFSKYNKVNFKQQKIRISIKYN